jgi:hypothetical protein
MNELRDALDRELRDTPPSSVDIESVLLRERRRGRWLRVATAGSAAVAVAALIGGITVLNPLGAGGASHSAATPTLDPGRPSGPVQAPSGAPRGTAPAWPLPKCPPGTDMSMAAPEGKQPLPVGRGPQLTAALTKAVHAATGNPRLGPSNWGSVHRPLVFSGGPCDPRYAEYLASAAVLGPSGTRIGDLMAYMEWEQWGEGATSCAEAPAETDKPNLACVERRGPHGEKIVAVTRRTGKQGTPVAIWYDVFITRPGGTVVYIDAGGSGPSQPNPPFSIDQLIAIGLDPGLTLS